MMTILFDSKPPRVNFMNVPFEHHQFLQQTPNHVAGRRLIYMRTFHRVSEANSNIIALTKE